jgi:hypothetical protein
MAVSKLLILSSRADSFHLENAEIYVNLTVPHRLHSKGLARRCQKYATLA